MAPAPEPAGPVPAPLITAPEQATPQWLTRVLVAAGVAPPGARVRAVDVAPIGAGKVGRTVRFTLSWTGAGSAGAPGSVVGKFAADDERSRRTGTGSDAYRRELCFYRCLAARVGPWVPRCYVAEMDAESGGFVLLLGDAAPAQRRDQVRGATAAEIAAALRVLARLHAPFWGGHGLAGLDWLPHRDGSGGRRLAAIYRLTLDGFLARFGDRLSGGAVAALERFGPLVRAWLAADRPPYTLLHGDFRLDNLLFGTGTGAAPLTIVDWQTALVGPAASDAAYLVGGSLPTPVRRRVEGALFVQYWQGLRHAGVEADRAACWRTYRINTLAGLHMTVVGAMLVGADEHGDEMFRVMAERHAAHVADLDAFALLGG